ncbi:hypothetical protein BDR07DRAFT_1382725 [Suillus spraguei]|nr:hypothetical protein BDR07DRAFT_1382725 [Suillus spraguei]
MSSAEHANSALNLVADKIVRLTSRAQQLKESDPSGMRVAHEIAVTLATAFTQHGKDATSLSPILLSCAAEIRDKSGPDFKLKALPDWTTVSNEDPRIRNHPLHHKTIGYQPPPSPPPATASSLPTPPVKHNLFVRGSRGVDKKRRASTPEQTHAPPPEAKRQKVAKTPAASPPPEKRLVLGRAPPKSRSRAPSRRPKSKEFVSDDEDDDVPTKDIIVVKRKAIVGTSGSVEPGIAGSSKPLQPAASSGEDSVTCERCIKDEIPCAVILSKKSGEVRKCCRNCDEKKTKCIRPDAERADLLRRIVAAKKAKAEKSTKGSSPRRAKSKSRPKASAKTRSISRKPSRPSFEESERDAEGEDDPDTVTTMVAIKPVDDSTKAITPSGDAAATEHSDERKEHVKDPPTDAPVVDNDVNMDVVPETLNGPEVVQKDVIIPTVAQPTALDIFRSIETLDQKFDAMLKTSGNRAEILHQEMTTLVNSLDDYWAKKFAAMEERLQVVEMRTAGSTVSIGHMANAANIFHQTGRPSASNPPPTASSSGNQFGQISGPRSSQIPDTPLPEGQTLSDMGKELATVWDNSRAPPAGSSDNASASAAGPSTNGSSQNK